MHSHSPDPTSRPDRPAGHSGAAKASLPGETNGHGEVDMYQLLVTSVVDYAIFLLNPEGYVASWNEGAQRIKGYSADEIIDRHFSTFYSEEDLAWDKPAFELDVAARDGRFEDEGWRLRKDGTRFWANVVITALRNEARELVGYAKVTRDLTERRQAMEQALADARRIATEEAARTTAEARAEEFSRLAAELEIQTREAQAATLELEYQVEEAQALSEELEQTNAQMLDAMQDAEAANRVKSDFLAAMSHELRTPLNAIGGYADLLLLHVHGSLTDEQRTDIERIRRNQQHLLGIINDILNFSRIEAGHLTYELAPVPMEDVMDGVRGSITPQAQTHGLAYEQSSCTPDAVAYADQTKVEQILRNLVSNAVKFTPSGGRITVSCESDQTHVILRVQDTGIGIERDKLDAIFEPFVQVGRSLTQPSEGTGLGLAISRDLARNMGGNITVESEVGQGSTFTVRLPRYQEPPNAHTRSED